MTIQEKIRIKAQIIVDLNGMKNEMAMRELFTLIDILIAEKREESDTVAADRLGWNQGFVAGISQIREYIEKGVPVMGKDFLDKK